MKQNKHKLLKPHGNLEMMPLSKNKEASGGNLSAGWAGGAGARTPVSLTHQTQTPDFTISAAQRPPGPDLRAEKLLQAGPAMGKALSLSLGPKHPTDDTGKWQLYPEMDPEAYITGVEAPSEKTQNTLSPQHNRKYKREKAETGRDSNLH